MKKLLFIIFIFAHVTLSALSIDERKTDIYFGNGVWNKEYTRDCNEDDAASCSQDTLNDLIQNEIIKGDPVLQEKYGSVKLQYNYGTPLSDGIGAMNDVLETYYQLKEAGQVSATQGFFTLLVLLRGDLLSASTAAALYSAYEPMIISDEQDNVTEMMTKYYNESLSFSHRVLLVSHSQGNLFANRVYDALSPTEYGDYFIIPGT